MAEPLNRLSLAARSSKFLALQQILRNNPMQLASLKHRVVHPGYRPAMTHPHALMTCSAVSLWRLGCSGCVPGRGIAPGRR